MISLVGAGGFIGRHLRDVAIRRSITLREIGRNEIPRGEDLGDLVYAAGVTADFRNRPFATVDAHVSRLAELLERNKLTSITYLSTTRVYARAAVASEAALLPIDVASPEDLYALTKLTGERLCASSGIPATIVRLSNVLGYRPDSPDFFWSVLRDASHGSLTFRSAAQSAKDYVDVENVADAIIELVVRRQQGTFNVASGRNTTHGELADLLRAELQCRIEFAENAPNISFPPIDIRALRAVTEWNPNDPVVMMRTLIRRYRQQRSER